MFVERTLEREHSLTQVTFVVSFARVYGAMYRESARHDESFAAVSACVWTFPGVFALVIR